LLESGYSSGVCANAVSTENRLASRHKAHVLLRSKKKKKKKKIAVIYDRHTHQELELCFADEDLTPDATELGSPLQAGKCVLQWLGHDEYPGRRALLSFLLRRNRTREPNCGLSPVFHLLQRS
jgi:hypothetical protein